MYLEKRVRQKGNGRKARAAEEWEAQQGEKTTTDGEKTWDKAESSKVSQGRERGAAKEKPQHYRRVRWYMRRVSGCEVGEGSKRGQQHQQLRVKEPSEGGGEGKGQQQQGGGEG